MDYFKDKEKLTIVGVGLVVLIALITIVLIAMKGEDNEQKSFTTPTYPFSFDYPSNWKLTRDANFTYGPNNADRSVSVVYKNPYDQVTITEYPLKVTLPEGVNGNLKEINKVVDNLAKQANGTASDATVVKYGNTPGYQYIVEYTTADGTEVNSTLTFLFLGDKEYQITCQSTPPNKEEMNIGCEQILNSIKFD